MNRLIVHYGGLDKFLPSFVDLVNEEFDPAEHLFMFGGDLERYPVKAYPNFLHFRNVLQLPAVLRRLFAADKIILHGMFHDGSVAMLYLLPWLNRKTYWVIWGGDLCHAVDTKHDRTLRSRMRNAVIRRMKGFVTYVKTDYERAKHEFGSDAAWHECIMYRDNVVSDEPAPAKKSGSFTVLLGNSATPSNNHSEALRLLENYRDENIRILCPLSYGDPAYAEKVAEKGRATFGEKFVPLRDWMPFEEYRELLRGVDAAFFNHSRQQAMGNTVALLGMGKAVYLRKDTGVRETLESLGLKTFDVADFTPEPRDGGAENAAKAKAYFNRDTLLRQLGTLFSS